MRSLKMSVVIVSLVLQACSSAPPFEGGALAGSGHAASGGDDDDASGDATDADPTSIGGGSSNDGTGSTGQASTASKNACSAEKTQKTCFECCTAKAPEAIEIYTGALESCLCQSPGTCRESCSATLCAGFKADTQCAECLRTLGTSCEDTAFTTCENDAKCAPMLSCSDEAHCSAK